MCLCLLSGVSVAMFKHHTGAITSVEWHPTDSSVFVASGSDDQVTLWDLAVERDSEADGKGRQLDVPPQLLFIHMVSDDEWSVTYWGLFWIIIDLHTWVLFILLHPFWNHYDPCNLIGSHQCTLFTNRTIICTKSHLFPSQWGYVNKIQQPIACLIVCLIDWVLRFKMHAMKW